MEMGKAKAFVWPDYGRLLIGALAWQYLLLLKGKSYYKSRNDTQMLVEKRHTYIADIKNENFVLYKCKT